MKFQFPYVPCIRMLIAILFVIAPFSNRVSIADLKLVTLEKSLARLSQRLASINLADYHFLNRYKTFPNQKGGSTLSVHQ